MEPVNGKWASSRVDLGYTEIFCIPEVHQCSSLFFENVPGDSLVFHQENRGSLPVWEYRIALLAMQGNRASFPSEGHVS